MPTLSFDTALTFIAQGRACLFLGAGFSRGFKDIDLNPLPSGSDLIKEMVSEADGRDTSDLMVAAKQLLKSKGSEDYISFLRNRFTVRETNPAAEALASEKWIRVYTTNFDDGFERSSTNIGKKYLTATASDLPAQYMASPRVCIHIHGFVNRISTSTVENDIVLTLPGYASGQFLASPWKTFLKHDLMAASAVFFVGYSLRDLDVARVLEECDPSVAEKTFFVIGSDGNSDLEILLEDYGTVLPLGLDGFAERLKNLDHNDIETRPLSYSGFEDLQIPRNPRQPSDADLYRLLMSGFLDDDLILSRPAQSGQRAYTVQRDLVGEVMSFVSGDRRSVVYITGEFSNGKTVALRQLESEFLSRNYKVLDLRDPQGPWPQEIRYTAQNSERPIAFFVDDFQLYRECGEEILLFMRKGDVAVFSDRTLRSEANVTVLRKGVDTGELIEIDVDILSEGERERVVSLLNEHGLWGDYAKANAPSKSRIIEENFDNQLRGILLGVLQSPDALQRLQSTLSDINFRDPKYDGVLLTLILAVTKAIDLRLHIVDDLSGSTALRRILSSSEGARALVRIRSPNTIRTVSSIVAETIVQKLVPVDSVVRCIITAIRRSQERIAFPEYKAFPRRIMPFRLIQRLLPSSESLSLKGVEEIYDSVKALGSYARDPQFWLQYAICQLFLRDYSRAEKYFKNAYACCGPTYDRSFIDNHYARYLLESSVEGPDAPLQFADAERRFERAKSLLHAQFKEDLHYPYRVALNLEGFIAMYGHQFTEEARAGAQRFIEHVLKSANQAIANGAGHRYIYRCVESLNRATLKLKEISN